MVPSLGSTVDEVLHAWQTADPGPCRNIVGWIPAYGMFDWRDGALWWLFPASRSVVATCQLATSDDVGEVIYAIKMGWLQIEARPYGGLFRGQGGQGTGAEAVYPTLVLHQATGVPF